jgi:hypothetical protein
MFQWLAMRLRGTQPGRVYAAVAKAEAAGLPVGALEIEAHLLAGGNISAVLDAMIEARRRGLPDRFAVLAEAQLAGVDLSRFVAANYQDADLKTLTGLRQAAGQSPEAALRLAERLAADLDALEAARARGPTKLAERFVWGTLDQVYAQECEALTAELCQILAGLPTGGGSAIRARLARAV